MHTYTQVHIHTRIHTRIHAQTQASWSVTFVLLIVKLILGDGYFWRRLIGRSCTINVDWWWLLIQTLIYPSRCYLGPRKILVWLVKYWSGLCSCSQVGCESDFRKVTRQMGVIWKTLLQVNTEPVTFAWFNDCVLFPSVKLLLIFNRTDDVTLVISASLLT